MSDDTPKPGSAMSSAAGRGGLSDERPQDLRRRLIMKGGLIAGGVVMLTVSNRPAWAQSSNGVSHNMSGALGTGTNNTTVNGNGNGNGNGGTGNGNGNGNGKH